MPITTPRHPSTLNEGPLGRWTHGISVKWKNLHALEFDFASQESDITTQSSSLQTARNTLFSAPSEAFWDKIKTEMRAKSTLRQCYPQRASMAKRFSDVLATSLLETHIIMKSCRSGLQTDYSPSFASEMSPRSESYWLAL